VGVLTDVLQGAIGDLDSSSQHLRGVSAALQGIPDEVQVVSLPQRMLKMYVMLVIPVVPNMGSVALTLQSPGLGKGCGRVVPGD
jgi:hypothetical protein